MQRLRGREARLHQKLELLLQALAREAGQAGHVGAGEDGNPSAVHRQHQGLLPLEVAPGQAGLEGLGVFTGLQR